MRAVFGVVSLLVVLAIVSVLVKKQMGALTVAPPAGIAIPAGATPQQQSQQIQTQVKQSVDAAMQQARPMPDDK